MYIYIYTLIIINTYKDILIHICVHMCMFFVVFSSFFWCCCLLLFPLFPHFPLLSIKKTKMRSLQNIGLRDLDARFIFPVEPIWSFYSHWLKVDRFFKPCRFLEAFLQWRSGPVQFTSELLWQNLHMFWLLNLNTELFWAVFHHGAPQVRYVSVLMRIKFCAWLFLSGIWQPIHRWIEI